MAARMIAARSMGRHLPRNPGALANAAVWVGSIRGSSSQAFADGVPVGAECLADPAELADEGDLCCEVGVLHVLDDLGFDRRALKVGSGGAEDWLEKVDELPSCRRAATEDHEGHIPYLHPARTGGGRCSLRRIRVRSRPACRWCWQ